MPQPEQSRPRIEPNLRRIRAFLGGRAVADSSRTVYLFEPGRLPVYYFPREDVRFDLLDPASHHTHSAAELKDYVTIHWDAADAWFEEDDEVFVHARDPYHRVDVLSSSRHVEVRVNGVLVADTRRPRLLFETGLPVRYYIPKPDVRMDLLEPTATRTRCPYKGEAVYWSVQAGGEVAADIVWSYPYPIPEIPKIENLLAFFNEKVDITVDGVPHDRPVTKWS
jgi:uncharacterized protein (DUF427 family)